VLQKSPKGCLGVQHLQLLSLTSFPLCFGIGLIEPKPLCVLEASHAWAFLLVTGWQLKTRLLRDVLPMRWRDANTC
jgi:hypothetical protein